MQNEKSAISKLVNHPWIVAAGWLFGLAGLVIGIYTYFDSKAYRELSVSTSTTRTVIVKSGEISDFDIRYRDRPVVGDISATQVALWNNGKVAIKPNDILSPIVIKTSDGQPILKVTTRIPGRDVSDIILDESRLHDGVLGISWKILEHNDGTVIQLIYGGGPDVQFKTEGVIEGQKSINNVMPIFYGVSVWVFILMIPSLIVQPILLFFSFKSYSGGFNVFLRWGLFALYVFMIIFAAYKYFVGVATPFGSL